jgi:hypothetical protein
VNREQGGHAAEQPIETALYFPYIRVPRTPWFTQVLLYWDRAASIVPEALRPEDDGLNPYMQDLNRAGLLDYVRPAAALGNRRNTFEDAFVALLDAGNPPPPEDLRTYERIHVDKMTRGLFIELHDRGLAAPTGPRTANWWKVESATAAAYMAYLASAISGAKKGMLPVTDQEDAIATLDLDSSDFRRRLAHLRYSTITRALPAPRGAVSAADLIDFKEKNLDVLRRCRKYLDHKLSDLAKEEDPEAREARADWVLQGIEDEVASLTEKMERRRWPRITLGGFGGITAAGLTAATPLMTGGSLLQVGLAVGIGLLELGAAASPTVADLIKVP